MKRRWIAGALIVAAALLGARAARSAAQAAAVEPAAANAAPAAAGGAAAPAGKADGYSIVDIAAIKKLMQNARGHVVLVHFWATWCGPCLQELPVVDRFAREMKPRGIEVLSLSLDNPRTAGPRVGSLLRRVAPNLTRTIAKFDDPDGFISAFDTRWEGAIPALFAYDANGKLHGTLIGESSRQDLNALVADLLKSDGGAPAAPPK
jgi:thiol-disulfide isomerase/thioredoxin